MTCNTNNVRRLLACPFCGKTGTVRLSSSWEDDNEYHDGDEMWTVCCDASEPLGPGGCGATCGYSETPDSAAEKWNHRHSIIEGDLT